MADDDPEWASAVKVVGEVAGRRGYRMPEEGERVLDVRVFMLGYMIGRNSDEFLRSSEKLAKLAEEWLRVSALSGR